MIEILKGIIHLTSLKRLVHLLSNDPSNIKFLHLWIQSLLFQNPPLKNRYPWITFNAIKWLEKYLNKNVTLFEFGSGGSTFFWAERVKKLISVEHDKKWYDRVSKELIKEGIKNCDYILSEPIKDSTKDKIPYGYKSYTSTLKEYEGMSFENYVKTIENYPDSSFDLVVIDGRARASCIFRALRKIRPGGFLMLDNSDREHYHKAIVLLNNYKRTDFFGLVPYRAQLYQTSIWEKI